MKQKDPARKIRIYPSLALKMLDGSCRIRNKPTDSVYRVWLILRDIDPSGAGYASLAELQQATADTFGKRRLKKILQLGEGIFWNRHKNKQGAVMVRSTSTARLAAYADLICINGSPVEIPSSWLYQPIAAFRAALAGTFDASRKDPRPITRKRKRLITGRCARTQRSYEKKIGTSTTRNYGIIDNDYSIDKEREAWWAGKAVFRLVDHEGKTGNEPGTELLAECLPNTYKAPESFQPVSCRANKRLNSKLKQQQDSSTNLLKKGQRVISAEILPHGSKKLRVFHSMKHDKVTGDGYWKIEAGSSCGIYTSA